MDGTIPATGSLRRAGSILAATINNPITIGFNAGEYP